MPVVRPSTLKRKSGCPTGINDLILFPQMSFIIPPEAIPGRLSALFTLFLCMINTLNSVTRESPKADSSPTALVDWIIICLIFLLLAILEYSWVLTAHLRAKNHQKIDSETKKVKAKPFDLDKIMTFVFPFIFLTSAFVFWSSVWSSRII